MHQPTLLYLTSGGPTWTRQDCEAKNLSSSPSSTSSSSVATAAGSNSENNINTADNKYNHNGAGEISSTTSSGSGISRNFPLTDKEKEILQRNVRENAQSNDFLRQFTFLKDDTSTFLAERFSSLAPMAQVKSECTFVVDMIRVCLKR